MTTLTETVQLAGQTATPMPGTGPEELVEFWPVVVGLGWFLAGLLVVVAVGWFLVEPAISRFVSQRNRNNPTIQDAITRYVRVLVLVVGAVVGAAVAGYTSLLTDSALVVAAGALVIGVAAQTVIASLVSGLVLVFDPEFNVGDYITWGEYEGTIRTIGLRVTRVQTRDGELVTVPNTALTGQAITRPYGGKRFRVVETFRVGYTDSLPTALEVLARTASTVDGIAAEPTPAAYVDEFESSAIRLRTHYWIEAPRPDDVFEIRSAYARACKRRLEDAGVTLSPPSQYPLTGQVELVDGRDEG